jgi:hypothetical protein
MPMCLGWPSIVLAAGLLLRPQTRNASNKEAVIMTNEQQGIKEEILRLVSEASDQRLRPHDLEKTFSHRPNLPLHTVQQAIKDLVEEGKLAYTYRDPTSYLELAERGTPVHPVI